MYVRTYLVHRRRIPPPVLVHGFHIAPTGPAKKRLRTGTRAVPPHGTIAMAVAMTVVTVTATIAKETVDIPAASQVSKGLGVGPSFGLAQQSVHDASAKRGERSQERGAKIYIETSKSQIHNMSEYKLKVSTKLFLLTWNI